MLLNCSPQFGKTAPCRLKKGREFFRSEVAAPQFRLVRSVHTFEFRQCPTLGSIQPSLGEGSAQPALFVEVKTGVSAEVDRPPACLTPACGDWLRHSWNLEFRPFNECRRFPKQVVPVHFLTRHDFFWRRIGLIRREF
jgi:hypothetical protein